MYEATMMTRMDAIAISSNASSYFAVRDTPRYGRYTAAATTTATSSRRNQCDCEPRPMDSRNESRYSTPPRVPVVAKPM
jgi:hypothetical protein